MSLPTSAAANPLSRRSMLRGALGLAGAGTLAALSDPLRPAAAATSNSFVADFATAGFSRYPYLQPAGVAEGLDLGRTKDPAGSGRTVAFFDNNRGLRIPGTMDRSEAEAPRFVRPLGNGVTNDEWWFAASAYVPAPTMTLGDHDWFSLATPAYGAPFNGTSPLSLVTFRGLRKGEVRLVLGGDYRLLGWEFGMPTDTWCRVLLNFKFAYNGWVRMWVGTGLTSTHWQQVPIMGKSRYYMPTMGRGINDACAHDPQLPGNSSRIGAYGWDSRAYYGQHVITQSYYTAIRAMR